MNLEINFMEKSGTFIYMWSLNHILPNNQWVKEGLQGERKCLKTNENENTPQFVGYSKSNCKKRVPTDKCLLLQETRKVSTLLFVSRKYKQKKQNPNLVEERK